MTYAVAFACLRIALALERRAARALVRWATRATCAGGRRPNIKLRRVLDGACNNASDSKENYRENGSAHCEGLREYECYGSF